MKKAIAAITTFLLPSLAVLSQWTLIDDFQQWTGESILTDSSEMGWHSVTTLTDAEYWILEDPQNSSNVCLFPAVANWGSTDFNWISKELPEGGIAPGETGTLRFRALWTGNQNSWHIGTADKAAVYDPVTGDQIAPGGFDDFNALILLDPETNVLESWNGENIVSSDPPREIITQQWYTFYLVINNSWKTSASPPVSTGYYSLYLNIPNSWDGWSIPVPFESAFFKNWSPFRRAPIDDNGQPQTISWIMFGTSSKHPSGSGSGSPFLLDDFYFSKGRNVHSLHEIDTGNWLGWINVSKEPFVFSYSLGWMYIEDLYSNAPGAWAYIYK